MDIVLLGSIYRRRRSVRQSRRRSQNLRQGCDRSFWRGRCGFPANKKMYQKLKKKILLSYNFMQKSENNNLYKRREKEIKMER